MNVDVAIADIITSVINRDELLDVECAIVNADLIERADLLGKVLPDGFRLVADNVGRFDTEAYCGKVFLSQKSCNPD